MDPASSRDVVQVAGADRPWKQLLQSRTLFILLQVLDLATTLAAFRVGGYEMNPLVANLTLHFGQMGGVLISKLFAVVIAFGVRRLVWVVNLFYGGIVLWNCVIVLLSSLRLH